MVETTEWIAVDWGTSNLRAWGIATDGAVTFSRSSHQGMGKLTPPEFPGVLTSLLADAIESEGPPFDVVICGMAGALLSGRSQAWCAGFLSGLLIGAEIGGFRDGLHEGEVPLIGSMTLCALYARALLRVGAASRIIDATEATLAGLRAARLAS